MKDTMAKRFKPRFGIPAGEEIRRILISRTCRMEAFREIVEDVRTAFPGCELYCITNNDGAAPVKDMNVFDGIFTYKSNPFGMQAIDSGKKKELKEKGFDLCVLPYNNIDGAGYAEWRLFFLRMGAKYCFGCDGRLGNRFAQEFREGRFGYFTEVEYFAKDILGTVVSASLFCAFVGLVGVGMVLKNVLKPIEPQIEKVYWKTIRSRN